MKHDATIFLYAVVLCLLVFPMTNCSSPESQGVKGKREPEVDFILPGDVLLEMVRIPAGTFMMGAMNAEPNEKPVHQVTLTRDFQLGKYEITKAQWQAVLGTKPWSDLPYVLDDPNSPVVYVTRNDAQVFITALNKLTNGTFRLPTEAEWEYACRAGTTTEFSFGEDVSYLGDYAWYIMNAWEVGQQYAPKGWTEAAQPSGALRHTR